MLKILKDIVDVVEVSLKIPDTILKKNKTIKKSLFPEDRIETGGDLVKFGRTPVILIQGYMMNSSAMSAINNALKDAGFEPIVFTLKRLGFENTIEEMAEDLAGKIKEFMRQNMNGKSPFRKRITGIGFSMGGVILHYMTRSLGMCAFIDKVITIASPINGLKYAVAALPFVKLTFGKVKVFKSAYELWEGSDFIRKLKKKPFSPNCYFVSISSEDDWMAPPDACRLPELPNTKNITLPHLFHSDLPFSQKVTQIIMEILLKTEVEEDKIKYI